MVHGDSSTAVDASALVRSWALTDAKETSALPSSISPLKISKLESGFDSCNSLSRSIDDLRRYVPVEEALDTAKERSEDAGRYGRFAGTGVKLVDM